MKKLLLASLFLLTLTSCGRDEAEMQAENKIVVPSLLNSISAKYAAMKGLIAPLEVHRQYSYEIEKHFFGINVQPPGSAPNKLRWRYEQIAFTLDPGNIPGGNAEGPVISMIHPINLDNLLVTSPVERQSAESQGYIVIENLGASVHKNTMGASPVYRYFRPSKSGHLYTKNFAELGNGGNGWVYEGIAFYAY